MSVIVYPKKSTTTALTISLASLASSATFVAGREATEIDNSTTKYDKIYIFGKFKVGTTPTVNTMFNLYMVGSDVSLATTPIDVLDGVDSAETITNTGVLGTFKAPISIPILANTSDISYPIPLTDITPYFGESVPNFITFYAAHNSGVNLNATAGDHVINWYGENKELI